MNTASAPKTRETRLRQTTLKMPGGGVEAVAAAVAAEGPLDPADRDAEDQQRDEVGDHEGAAAVQRRAPGKRRKLPRPTAEPATAMMTPSLVDHCSLSRLIPCSRRAHSATAAACRA